MAIGVMRAGDACRGVFSRTRSRSRRAGKPCARLRAAALDAADGIGEAELQPQLSFEWGSGHWPSPQSVVKLVATDVDGTLLNSHHKLSQANIQVCVLCHCSHLRAAPARARPERARTCAPRCARARAPVRSHGRIRCPHAAIRSPLRAHVPARTRTGCT